MNFHADLQLELDKYISRELTLCMDWLKRVKT